MRQIDGVILEAIYYDVVHTSYARRPPASTYEADAVIKTVEELTTEFILTHPPTSLFCVKVWDIVSYGCGPFFLYLHLNRLITRKLVVFYHVYFIQKLFVLINFSNALWCLSCELRYMVI